MLKQRVITAIILIVLIGSGIVLLPLMWLAAMFGLLVIISAWEWGAMSGLQSPFARSLYTVATMVLMLLTALYSQLLTSAILLDRLRDIFGLAGLWWAVALLWVRSYPASAVVWRSVGARMLMGFLTLIPAWLALVYLGSQQQGAALIFVLIVLVAAADIGAYFTGRAWGKAKLAPSVSPGKSWAGFWGGLTVSTSLALLIWWFFGRDLPEQSELSIATVAAIAIATALASVLGDLLESMVKRQQGLKDSGRILPGHGGMMDRLDSMTAAAPVFALCLILANG